MTSAIQYEGLVGYAAGAGSKGHGIRDRARMDVPGIPAVAGIEGDDAIDHGVENRLDQRGTVAQRLLRCIVLGDVAEHQHGTDHLIAAVADRRATVGNIALGAIAGNQDGVVGQTLHCAPH